ncbi:DNA polymerase III subunit epsilon [Sodalis endosymbiont of Henestaris halophilus]|uniref:DNA polymerase III subunit epsilon n=1 Tax=Sodalis endosymbiont of Henestaris halophilus TaxID=1929246 RepID=UPI000BE32E9A|nr:DNA polymerase III subunit epsilon [Sodalis endosymbiont of Henestaris halophilus]
MSTDITRQIFLDTETTGINKFGVHYEGHRIIEIGAIEVINRRFTGRHFHTYLKPDRYVDPEAFNIHGISDEFLIDKLSFAEVADEFLQFIRGGELVIHNAPFDIGFIDYEFSMLNLGIAKTDTMCKVTDSLLLARKMFPGKRNSLNALCDRYFIDNSRRTYHGALLDAEILAAVFLRMTSSQTAMHFVMEGEHKQRDVRDSVQMHKKHNSARTSLKVVYANIEEVVAHEKQLDLVQKKSGNCLWRKEITVQSE